MYKNALLLISNPLIHVLALLLDCSEVDCILFSCNSILCAVLFVFLLRFRPSKPA